MLGEHLQPGLATPYYDSTSKKPSRMPRRLVFLLQTAATRECPKREGAASLALRMKAPRGPIEPDLLRTHLLARFVRPFRVLFSLMTAMAAS